VLDADGTGLRRLTVNVGMENSGDGSYAFDDSVAWSPDGRRIAFFRTSSHCTGCPVIRDVYLISPQGRESRRLTRTPDVIERDLAWSPDGRKIAFSTDGYWGEVFVMNADGRQRRHLTFAASSGYCAGPSWSPGGRRIALYCGRSTKGGWQIYVVGVKGGAMKQLTDTEASSLSPSWSPEGSKIAFTSNRDGHFQLYLMNADGTRQQRLTRSRTADFHPVWQPGP
jgi:TolB protein